MQTVRVACPTIKPNGHRCGRHLMECKAGPEGWGRDVCESCGSLVTYDAGRITYITKKDREKARDKGRAVPA